MSTIIAWDPGFGNSKIAIGDAVSVIQSAVSRPAVIGHAAVGMRVAAAATQVTTRAGIFACGSGSWNWGRLLGGMDYSTIGSEARQALFYAGVAQLLNPGEYQVEMVIGLPVQLLANQAEAETVMTQLRDSYKVRHEFGAAGAVYCLDVTRLHVLAQPVGAWNDWSVDGDLHMRADASEKRVAIIDLGMNTLDLYVLEGKRVVPAYIGGDRVGARRLLENLDGRRRTEEKDAMLRAGKLTPSREALDSWLSEVLGVVEQTWPEMNQFDTVIPAGGGAVILSEQLHQALTDRGAAVAWPDDPITTNVRGMWKWRAYNSKRG